MTKRNITLKDTAQIGFEPSLYIVHLLRMLPRFGATLIYGTAYTGYYFDRQINIQ